MSVREQIAREWVTDLDTLVTVNQGILESYYAIQNETRSLDKEFEDCLGADDKEPQDCFKEFTSAREKTKAFDRTSMYLLSNSIEFGTVESSPYRKGNFDLLCLLATQESIHRVLRDYREAGEERRVSLDWLRDFYVKRVRDFFDGQQSFGRADDFLEELLLTSPSLKTVGKKIELIDPLRIAEDIIETRSQVGKDWKEELIDVPNAHMIVRRIQLQRQMAGAANESPFANAYNNSATAFE
jgi:hypothetical protein